MTVTCRDLGRMDYGTCWEVQRSLFDALLARKRGTAACGADAGDEAAFTPGPPRAESCGRAAEPLERSRDLSEAAWRNNRLRTERTENDSGAGSVPDTSGTGEGLCRGGAPKGNPPAPNALGIPPEDAGTILFVEHPPVYTLGKSGRAENLLVSRKALEALGAQFFHIDRGGDITFHGPGQLVCYPILDLERIGMGLRDYIDALEQAVIRTAPRFGVAAGRIAGASGVWLGEGTAPTAGTGRPRKLCAIGVRSSRYITMHGLALNVSTDLDWFAHINPCGFIDRGVTSLERETGKRVKMSDVREQLGRSLGETLGVRIR